MRRKARQGLAIASLSAAVALAFGCGSDDNSSTTTALSQSEFVAEATAICTTGNEQIDAGVHRYLSGRPSSKDVEKFVDSAVVPATQREIDEFEQLVPPSRADTYQSMLEELRSALNQVEDNPQLLGSQKGTNPFAKAQQLAGQIGLSACVES